MPPKGGACWRGASARWGAAVEDPDAQPVQQCRPDGDAVVSAVATAISGIPARRVRLGALALIVAGLLMAPQGPLTFNIPSDPAHNLDFATGANSAIYRLAMTLTGIGIALMVLGLFALYARLAATEQERLAFGGLVVAVGLLLLFLPMLGFANYVVPAVGSLVDQGRPEMIDVMDQTFMEPTVPIAFLGGLFWPVGGILFGMAIWRSRVLWKWGGLLLIASTVVGMLAFMDQKVFQIIGSPLSGLAMVVIGVDLWRSARPGAGNAPTSAA